MSLSKRLIKPDPGASGFTTWTQSTTYTAGAFNAGGSNAVVGGSGKNFYKYEQSGFKLMKNIIPASGTTLSQSYNVNTTTNSGTEPVGMTDWSTGFYGVNHILVWSYFASQSYGMKYFASTGAYTGQSYERMYLNNLTGYARVTIDAMTGLFSRTGGHFNGAYTLAGIGNRIAGGTGRYLIVRSMYSNSPATNPTVYNIDSTIGGYEQSKALMWDGAYLWMVVASNVTWYALKYDLNTASFIGSPVLLGSFGGYNVGSYPRGGWIDTTTNTAYVGGQWSDKLFSFTLS